MSVRIVVGDCREWLGQLEPNSIDACVCDPPYHLTSIVKRFGAQNAAPAKVGKTGAYERASRGFMGQTWDGTERPPIDPGLGHWIAGFADGEGCFTTRKSGKGYVCEFVIHIRADDGAILREVHRQLGIGQIVGPSTRKDGGHPMIKWVVSRQADCMRLVELFRCFPLRAKKKRDFVIWAEAVESWVAHEPGESWADLADYSAALSAIKQYGASFDSSQFFHYRWAKEVYRVLKPGAHLIAFGGTRTFHRLAAGIEDAGFEIRDQLAWCYGSGFPKSHNQKDEWEGWGTALKPAWEPICLARKPLSGTVADNLAKHGTGALNIDGCKIGDEVRHAAFTSLAPCHGNALGQAGTAAARRGTQGEPKEYVGRWPANIIHDGSDEVLAAFPESYSASAHYGTETTDKAIWGNGSARVKYAGSGDAHGSAARFFYCAKATTEERGEGNNHPTVKPVDLMRWLCRLVTPPGGTVLDPFMGSGSTLIAADAEQFNAIGCELSPDYAAIAEKRIRDAAGLFADVCTETFGAAA